MSKNTFHATFYVPNESQDLQFLTKLLDRLTKKLPTSTIDASKLFGLKCIIKKCNIRVESNQAVLHSPLS